MNKPTRISIQQFVPRDSNFSDRRIHDVAARLDIIGKATAAGNRNEPPASDEDLDEPQRNIVDQSVEFVGGLSRAARSKITDAINEVRDLLPLPLDATLEESTINLAVAEAKDRFGVNLDVAFDHRQRALRSLRRFEIDEGLAPLSATYRKDRLMSNTSLIAIGIAESGGNAFLLQELQTGGWIGAQVLSGGVSGVNILLGLAAGFFGWRLMIHRKRVRQILGIVLTLVFMGGGLALNLAMGDLREAIADDPAAKIDFLVILHPSRYFSYSSIFPAVLFAIGMATFTIAALKGRGGNWGTCSPYWGHDVFDRRFREADGELHDAIEDLKNAIRNSYDAARAQLREQHATSVSRLADIRRIVADAHSTERVLRDSIDAEVGRLETWLRMYRDANRLVRDTSVPAYFGQYPAFEQWRERLDLSELSEQLERSEVIAAENGMRLAALEEKTLRAQAEVLAGIDARVEASERNTLKKIKKDDGTR